MSTFGRFSWLAVVLLITISQTYGAPRHHHHHKSEKESQEKPSSRSYIDIDASDPFKVPKNSHYMDQDIPNDFDREDMKEEQTGRATVEGEVGTMPEGAPEEQPQEGAPEPGSPAEEGQQQQPQENEGGEGSNNGSLINQNLSSDLPPGITDKIDEIAKNQGGTPDGKPIEINENDLKNLVTNSAGGNEGENGQ